MGRFCFRYRALAHAIAPGLKQRRGGRQLSPGLGHNVGRVALQKLADAVPHLDVLELLQQVKGALGTPELREGLLNEGLGPLLDVRNLGVIGGDLGLPLGKPRLVIDRVVESHEGRCQAVNHAGDDREGLGVVGDLLELVAPEKLVELGGDRDNVHEVGDDGRHVVGAVEKDPLIELPAELWRGRGRRR